jgi:putative intracellular protease/amidase
MAETKSVLIVLTSNAELGETGEQTGFWAEEFAAPYYALADAGLDVTVASIKGGEAPMDPRSLSERGENPEAVERMLDDDALMSALKTTRSIQDVDAIEFDAIFLAGGHGTMWDFAKSDALAKRVARIWTGGGAVAAVCHGPAGLVNVTVNGGAALVDGKKLTAFTDSEEEAVGLTDAVPFLLESRLRALGGQFKAEPDFQPHVVVDGRLVTGQNPASSIDAAARLIEVLRHG